MALFNHATKELTAKIVYYGPGLCGKTTNLKILHQRLERGAGKLLSLSTAQDRTIYFDLLPIELGNIKGYTVRFQVCTVPGQVFYNETRRIVLRGVDGLVFVVDSQWSMLSHNLESFQNLRENLADEKIPLEALPVVIQYNKRDLPSSLSVEALQESLGFQSYPYVDAVASEGMGVLETFKLASKLTFVDLLRRLQRGWQPPTEAEPDAFADAASAAPPAPGPAVTISAPAPEPEDLASAPVLAFAGPDASSAEEPPEWIPPSAEGTFADLSDDSQKNVLAARAEASATSPAAPVIEAPRHVAPAERAVRSTSRPETTAPVTPLDDKLNAVLAEARKAAAGRISGTFPRRSDETPAFDAAASRRIEAAEKALERLEKAIDAERDERRRLQTSFEAEKAARAAAEERTAQALDALRSTADEARAAADAGIASLRADVAASRTAAEAALPVLRGETEEIRRGLADAVSAERASRESSEAAAREAVEGVASQIAALRDELAAARTLVDETRARADESRARADASAAAATAAADRARRLEEALREALSRLAAD